MFQSLSRRLKSLWATPRHLTMANNLSVQQLNLRYCDDELLEKDLNRILGEGNWKDVQVCPRYP